MTGLELLVYEYFQNASLGLIKLYLKLESYFLKSYSRLELHKFSGSVRIQKWLVITQETCNNSSSFGKPNIQQYT